MRMDRNTHPGSNKNDRDDSQATFQANEAFMEMFCRTMAKVSKEEKEKEAAANLTRPAAEEPKTIDLIELFLRIVENLHFIVIAAVVCAILCSFFMPNNSAPMYTATTKLYVIGNSDSVINVSTLQLGNQLAMDYQEVFLTWEVHEIVRESLNLDYSYSYMQSMLTVTNPEDTRILNITITNPDPQMAADLANAYAEAAKQFILKTMDTQEPNVFSVALVPSVPILKRSVNPLIVGFMLGTVLACGVIVLMYLFDDRPRSPEDILKYTGTPALAVIPVMKESKRNKRVNRQADRRNEASRD